MTFLFFVVQEYGDMVNRRIVSYINLDQPVLGNHSLKVESSPTLHDIIYNAAERVTLFYPLFQLTRLTRFFFVK